MFHPLRIRAVRRETADAVSIVFEVPEELRNVFDYTPGQFLTLRATLDGDEVRRCYSICAGLDDGELAVAVKHVPQGLFSHHANTALRVGDAIEGDAAGGAVRDAACTGHGTAACRFRRGIGDHADHGDSEDGGQP